MRLFTCAACGQLVYFENSRCTRCGHELGFQPEVMTLGTLAPGADGALAPIGSPGTPLVRCANAGYGACNWMVPAGGPALCSSCRLNRTIPDLSVPGNVTLWQEMETAKRRLVYALMRFDLPIAEGEGGLSFDFLTDVPGAPVLTGHEDGHITINLAEADSAERERRRTELGEAYRTLLGHFRHEVGHYYFDRLVVEGGRLDASRTIFGDEGEDYAAAMERHYREGARPDWPDAFVSAYATMHPWEDFAETWTHYLHIVDSLETAAAFGLGVDPGVTDDPALSMRIVFDPYRAETVETLISAWLPLTYAVNSLNRSMGQPDLYPFVLAEPAILKLGFVHDLVRSGSQR